MEMNIFGESFEKGALACITDINDIQKLNKIKEQYKNKIILQVKDSIKAIQDIAKYKRSLYKIPVVAITGSVRKNQHKRYGSKCFKRKV